MGKSVHPLTDGVCVFIGCVMLPLLGEAQRKDLRAFLQIGKCYHVPLKSTDSMDELATKYVIVNHLLDSAKERSKSKSKAESN